MKSKLHSAFLYFLLLLFFFRFTNTYASHAAGAALTYTHLSGNTYRLHFEFYRDCSGIPAPTSVVITAQSLSCGLTLQYTLVAVAAQGEEITLPCSSTLTVCNGGALPGVELRTYEADVVVPGQCPDWVFSNFICCRDAAITNLQNPNSENQYIEARLNNANADNSSPQFLNRPLVVACMNQDFHYNNGMFDPDGDSLVYNLTCAMSGPNTCINYMPGYSATQPFSSNPPITFDYFTGDLFMHPTAPEVGIIVFQVLEYRNGELIGSVMRDVRMLITPCQNANPTATHMNGTSQQIAYVFPMDTICFDVFTDDPDASDSVLTSWNQGIPGGSFTATNGLHSTGTFCWIPSFADVRTNPWMFTAMARDNYCPVNNAGVYSYYIYVTLDSSLVFLSAGGLTDQSTLLISPNPTTGKFEIRSEVILQTISVYNSLGECILRKQAGLEIDLSRQPAGLYILNATTAGGATISKKILKE